MRINEILNSKKQEGKAPFHVCRDYGPGICEKPEKGKRPCKVCMKGWGEPKDYIKGITT